MIWLRVLPYAAALAGVVAYGEWRASMARTAAKAALAAEYADTITEYLNADVPVDPAAVDCELKRLAGLTCHD